jgi:hypothetical protein
MLAESAANEAAPEADELIGKLREILPLDADAIAARLLLRQGNVSGATQMLESVFQRFRTDPWPDRHLVGRTCGLAEEAAAAPNAGDALPRLYRAMREPFSIYNAEEPRALRCFNLALQLDKPAPGAHTAEALATQEPWVPWQEPVLRSRKLAYERVGSPPLARRAERELDDFVAQQEEPLRYNVPTPPSPAGAKPTLTQP